MPHFRLRLFYLLTLALILLPAARGYDFPPLSDEDKNFKEVPGQPGAPAAVLYHEEIDDDEKNHYHMVYKRIKILTEAGRKYADVIVPFAKGYSDIGDVSGRTVHADGTVIPFDGKIYDKFVYKYHDVKVHVKSFNLPDVQVGSIIEYRYFFRYDEHRFIAPHWIIQDELWQKQVYFKFMPTFKELILRHEQVGRGISWTTFAPKELQPKETVLPHSNLSDPRSIVEIKGTNVPAFVEEPFMPDSAQFRYNTHFYYVINSKQEEFWKQEGKFWGREVDHFIDKNSGVSDQVRQIVSDSDTPEQKLKKIYDFVAKLENTTYVPAKTEQERKVLNIKDRGVSDILQAKSGDRNEITRLFIAMVRAAGIPAYAMTVTSREENYFEPAYLSPDQLDSEIAIVVLNGKEVFLDPGTKSCPYGMLDWRVNNTKGLRQSDHGVFIGDSPAPTYNDAIVHKIGRFVMNDDGSVEGNMKIVFLGQGAITHRLDALKTDAEGRKKALEDEVKGWLPAGADVKLTSEPAWDTNSKEFVVLFHVQTTLAANAGKRALLPVNIFQVNEKPMFPSATRVNGIYLYYPSREVDEVSITVPASMDVENLPQNENVRLDYALYKTEWSHQGKTITCKRDIAMADFIFPPNEYKDVKGFYDKVKAGDDQQAVLKVDANAVGK